MAEQNNNTKNDYFRLGCQLSPALNRVYVGLLDALERGEYCEAIKLACV